MSNSIEDLFESVLLERGKEPDASRTAKLFADGRIKIAKKLVEEATEVSLECVQQPRRGGPGIGRHALQLGRAADGNGHSPV